MAGTSRFASVLPLKRWQPHGNIVCVRDLPSDRLLNVKIYGVVQGADAACLISCSLICRMPSNSQDKDVQ
jgi:hypothetical protein